MRHRKSDISNTKAFIAYLFYTAKQTLGDYWKLHGPERRALRKAFVLKREQRAWNPETARHAFAEIKNDRIRNKRGTHKTNPGYAIS